MLIGGAGGEQAEKRDDRCDGEVFHWMVGGDLLFGRGVRRD